MIIWIRHSWISLSVKDGIFTACMESGGPEHDSYLEVSYFSTHGVEESYIDDELRIKLRTALDECWKGLEEKDITEMASNLQALCIVADRTYMEHLNEEWDCE